MFSAKNEILTRPSTGGYQISRSLRFNSADSAYLSRTPASTSSQTTATFSAWVKRSRLGSAAENRMFAESTGSGAGLFWVLFTTSDQIQILVNGSGTGITTTQVFRDPSAYYHVVVAVDTTQATNSNRIKLYVNGSQVTAFTGTQTYYSLNETLKFNVTTTTNYIGYSNSQAFDGYMTEVNWIDGQALTPSSFGSTNADTGVWGPKAFAGTYGTNGFYVNFSDNSNTTAATLGKDYSGNGNNWTPNNFSVTAGAGNDSLVDSPTSYGVDTGVGGTVRGNYCTWNPISNQAGSLANGNLQLNGTNAAVTRCNATMAVSSGKWYFETTLTTANSYTTVGIGQGFVTDGYPGGDALSYAQTLEQAQSINNNVQPSYGSVFTSGDIFMCAFDLDNNKLFFGKNGTWFGSSNPATGANPVYTLTAGTYCPIARPYDASSVINSNFGQRPFAYTAPSGFKALCTQNLPTPTIGATTATQAGKYFNPVLYTGTSANQSVAVGFQPDFVWIKSRSNTTNHALFDAVRGADKWLLSNATNAESSIGLFPSFDSNGFTVSNVSGNYDATNYNTYTYVSWNWKANGSGSSNTAGSITSTVSANTTSGFSVVTYTGNGVDASIGHGLGVAPSMVIHKFRSATSNWSVYTPTTGAGKRLKLNSTDAVATDGSFPTTPTSTVFYINGGSNDNGVTMVDYCFAPVAGYSAFGSYTGNGSADGPFVYTGMRPAFVIIKAISGTSLGNWVIQDNMRSPANVSNKTLYSNLSNAEDTSYSIDFLSNGFKLRSASYDATNQSGANYVYMAFAENPFKYSLAR